MGVSAIIEDGIIKNAQGTSSTSASKGGSTLGKDDFLQLLVAQMKYQDPLEPTSNTEYIAQYAQFSQVEQMQNMSQSMDLSRASTLVGQTVEITTTDENGVETTKMGKVDYVKYENGKALVSIDESLYDLDDVTYVCDKDYLEAYSMAEQIVKKLKNLPDVDQVTIAYKKDIDEVTDSFDNMNDYQKTFIAKQVQDLIEEYRKKLKEVKAVADKEAAEKVDALTKQLEALPALEEVTDDDMDAVKSAVKAFDSMSAYQKSFVSEEQQDVIAAYRKKLPDEVKDGE